MMKSILAAFLAVNTVAFTDLSRTSHLTQSGAHRQSSLSASISSAETQNEKNEVPFFVDLNDPIVERYQEVALSQASVGSLKASPQTRRVSPAKKKEGGAAHKEGVFSPAVKIAKVVMGERKLNEIRGKVISMHSDVIKDFVATADSAFGKAVLVRLFALADKNGDGKLDQDEVKRAVGTLGFTWLKDKQVSGILKRADLDQNGTIEFDEFVEEAPKTLKTNLVKLAKKNGGDMGLLV